MKKLIFKRSILLTILILLVGCTTKVKKNEKKDENRKPNILFVLMDDTGYSNLGCTGNPLIKTPNIDEMYKESVRFTKFGVSPTCSPTRAALMTGKNEFKSNVTHTINGRSNMDLNATTIIQLLKKQGYVTGIFGKWHLGNFGEYRPEHRDFDEAVTVEKRHLGHYDPVLIRNGVKEPSKGYRTDIIFDEAMKFIEKHKDEPFYCYLPTHSAHVPFVCPEKYSKPYEGIEGVSPGHYGMIANMDENMGRIRQKLKDLGLEDNTLVIFMSDNGPVVTYFNAGMRGRKNMSWYGGVRVNSFWKWPAKYKAGDRNQNASAVDFLPTIAEIIGAKIPAQLQSELEGMSLVPFMENKNTKEPKDRMLVHHMGRWGDELAYKEHKYAHCSVLWGDYQLIRTDICKNKACFDCQYIWKNLDGTKRNTFCSLEHYKLLDPKNEWALFNLKSDIHQDNNIAKEHPEIVKKMADFYENWWTDVETKLDVYTAQKRVTKH